MSAHDLHVSVLEVERLVASRNPFVTALLDFLAKFGWGQVGYGGDAQCGGGDGSGSIVGKCAGGKPHVMQDGERLDALQDWRRDTSIGRGGEIFGSESDGGFNLCRDSSSHFTLFFPLTFFRLRDVPLFFLVFPLQPRGMELAKFLVHRLVSSNGGRREE